MKQHGLSLQQSPDPLEYPLLTALHYPMAEKLLAVKRGDETVWQLPRAQGSLICFKKSCSDASRGKYCSGGFSFSLADKALYEVLGFPAFGLLFFFFYPGKLL